MKMIEMRPPRIALASTIMAAAIQWALKSDEGVRFAVPWFGVTLGLMGFFLMMWAWWLFKQRKLAICPTVRTASMITHGPYRITRNPMYLGMILMMLGLALYLGTLPFYLSAVAYFAILNFVFCPFEENKLSHAFGDEYALYKDQVRRWL